MTEPISGRMARLKPWHYALIGGVSVAGIALIPALNNLTTKKKAEDTTAAMLAASAGNAGEPWHPPTFPAPDIVTTTFKPTPPPPPVTPNPLVTTPPGLLM